MPMVFWTSRAAAALVVCVLVVVEITSTRAQAKSFGSFAETLIEMLPGNVFNDDARTRVTSTEKPFALIGRLESPDGGLCTAGLVGRDLILTAAHCVVGSGRLLKGEYKFSLQYAKGRARATSGVKQVTWGTDEPEIFQRSDWAILQLEEPLGDTFGWFGVKSNPLAETAKTKNIWMIGYSHDRDEAEYASWENGCTFPHYVPRLGILYHDCDMTPGASGAPMFIEERNEQGPPRYMIVALNVAQKYVLNSESGVPYSIRSANLAVPASAFIDTVKELKGELKVARD